ncbi:Ppx/GppA family phosphatase [Streptomyces roseirectus]|uniref:Ppx/GppA family phosphatase n=1 Tax=Streptomyces roseirectus TaxID=2768066 RepID=A0A7H0INL1_9ACTN|nr:Ppx/GppA family phosphatase [Streptomyces roseirectus]QNP74377.1 Ppx/GppA family phosphatase [Streptomyces roseirectus]
MRVSVVDAGSNTVRLVVTDARDGVPLPVHTAKWRLRLSEQVGADGRLGQRATEQLVAAVDAAARTARRWGAPDPLAFATAVVRGAPDREEVLTAVRERTGVRLRVLPGELEAELTFLAVRRWTGWCAGPLALFDIGGGSLEVAFGRGRMPEFAASLPLGANRLTTDFLESADPPSEAEIQALRRHVRHSLRDATARIRWERPQTSLATSRTFQQLARLCGAPPGRHGPFVERVLRRADLRRAVDRLAALPVAGRAALPGISAPRARQSLAGAIVAHSVLKLSGVRSVTICPWAVREGILLRLLEDGTDWWHAEAPARPHLASIPKTAEPSSTQAT